MADCDGTHRPEIHSNKSKAFPESGSSLSSSSAAAANI